MNFQLPDDTAPGRANVVVHRQDSLAASGDILLDSVAPVEIDGACKGEAPVVVKVNGRRANRVTVSIQ